MKMKTLLTILTGCILASSVVFAEPPKTKLQLDKQEVTRFSRAIHQIKKHYVKPVKDHQLFSEAIRGMLTGLDPHSTYLNAKDLKFLNSRTNGNFVGLGIEVTQVKGVSKVISPIDGTPAQKAGIQPGDYILAADGQSLINTPLSDVIEKLRGKVGTEVILTVINEKDKKQRTITIKREVIQIRSVKSKLFDKYFGYIRISHFEKTTANKLVHAIMALNKKAKGHELKGLILDLRNNPGGILATSAIVADTFLDADKLGKNKIIVSTKGRTKAFNATSRATSGDLLYGAPLIVLINQGSASASEVVAGALQDHKRAIIMGQHSFGKGSVQAVYHLDKNTGIKLTTALYYTPNGTSIQAKGITPDIVINNLKIQKPKEETLFIFNLKEKDLRKHIENAKKAVKQKSDLDTLATSDYQLYDALKLLKSLNILKKKDKLI